MDTEEILKGKRVLLVDDEPDILDLLADILDMCEIDRAESYDKARELLTANFYHVVVLDIMGVRGYDLLQLAKSKGIPALMLTAHALSKDSLKKSFQLGADYYVPKDEIGNIDIYLADILEAQEKMKNVVVKWYERLSSFFDRRFGPDWKDEDREFWETLIKY